MPAASPIDSYVSELHRSLSGPAGPRRDLVDEIRAGLHDAREEGLRRGLGQPRAESEAVAEFGPLEELTPQLQQELGLEQGRRTAALMLAFVGIQPAIWSFAERFVVSENSSEVGDALVQALGSAALLLALAGYLASGIGSRSRWVSARVSISMGWLACVAAATLAVGGLLLMLSGGGGVLAWSWLLLWLELPMLVLAVAGRRCLRSAGRA